jgi:hypothetical protein
MQQKKDFFSIFFFFFGTIHERQAFENENLTALGHCSWPVLAVDAAAALLSPARNIRDLTRALRELLSAF